MRRVDRLGLDAELATRTYYDWLLSYAGCTTDADIAAALFPRRSLLQQSNPVTYGSPAQTMREPAGTRDPDALHRFLATNAATMPRPALRLAVEKLDLLIVPAT